MLFETHFSHLDNQMYFELKHGLAGRLRPYQQALQAFFADLFHSRLPANWRERWHRFVDEQATLGFVTEPESVADVEVFIHDWARYWGLLPPEEERVALRAVEFLRDAANAAAEPSVRQSDSASDASFNRQLARAQHDLDAIGAVLESLSSTLNAATSGEEIDATPAVERVEALIGSYNAAIETARDIWLRDNLQGALNERLLSLKTPLAYGLPWFVDELQERRAMLQSVAISRRLLSRNTVVDRVVERMHTIELFADGIGVTLGGGASISIAKKRASWFLIKTGPDDPAGQATQATANIAASLVKLIIRKRKKGVNAGEKLGNKWHSAARIQPTAKRQTTDARRPPLHLIQASTTADGEKLDIEELLDYFAFIYGTQGRELLNAFKKSQGRIVISRIWIGPNSKLETRSFSHPQQIRLHNGLTPAQGAQELMERLIEATGLTEVRQHLDHTGFESIEVLIESYRQSVKQAAATVSFASQLYLSGISIANEGADWVITIHDLSEGNYYAAIGLLPLLPATVGTTGIVLKHGRKKLRISPTTAKYAKALPVDDLIELLESTRNLARNMEKAGITRPPDTAAHHIVPAGLKKFPSAVEARGILKRFDIDVNNAANGVYLPSIFDDEVKAAYHGTLHTEAYSKEVLSRLKERQSKEEVLLTLNEIRKQLLAGAFPH
jgi:hypothetical protein